VALITVVSIAIKINVKRNKKIPFLRSIKVAIAYASKEKKGMLLRSPF